MALIANGGFEDGVGRSIAASLPSLDGETPAVISISGTAITTAGDVPLFDASSGPGGLAVTLVQIPGAVGTVNVVSDAPTNGLKVEYDLAATLQDVADEINAWSQANLSTPQDIATNAGVSGDALAPGAHFVAEIFDTPWDAEGWTTTTVASSDEYACYDAGGVDVSIERFELGWQNDGFAFALPDSAVPAAYNTLLDEFDGFETEWSNVNWTDNFNLVSQEFASYDSGTPEEFEDFEEEWLSNESFLADWSAVTSDAASYDAGSPEPVEDFEDEWKDNQNYLFAMGPTDAASYDVGSPEPIEDFEEEWPTIIMQTL